jgi:hypothetical protein
MLKVAFGRQRMVTYESGESQRNEIRRTEVSRYYNPTIPPPSFVLGHKLRLLWPSNENYNDLAARKTLSVHFDPLVARGLDPWWIGDHRGNDNRALVEYTYWLVTEANLLRAMGFKYEHTRAAINFYLSNVNRLIDVPPRRVELIARAFANPVPTLRDASLSAMLAQSDLRPKLRLESQISVMLWPETPWKRGTLKPNDEPPRPPQSPPVPRESYPSESVPPPAPPESSEPQQEASSDAKPKGPHLGQPHPAAIRGAPPGAPIPPFPGGSPNVLPFPKQFTPPDGLDSPPPANDVTAAIRAIYDAVQPVEPVTCELLADVLRRFPTHDWDEADREHLAAEIQMMADWECHPLLHALIMHEEALKLFATAESVLAYDDDHGWRSRRWTDIETELAPQIADDERRCERRRREEGGRTIVSSRLPRVRKLRAMRQRIDRLLELALQISGKGLRAIDYIRAMTSDDPAFADCTTFDAYLDRASKMQQPADTR